MAEFLYVYDLQAFKPDIDPAKAQQMIDDATALAILAAPCLDDPENPLTSTQIGGVKAILRGAILRWEDAGSGAISQQTAGPFGQMIDTRNQRRSMFWPSEIVDLQRLCSAGSGGAFQVDTLPDADRGYTWTGPDTWVPLT